MSAVLAFPRRLFQAFVRLLSRPEASLVLCYGAGLLATRSLGEASAGGPILNLAAAAVAGLAIRYGRGFGLGDALRLGAVGLAFAAAFGESPAQAGFWIGLDFLSIWSAERLFARLRARGFVTSQTRLTGAVWLAAAAIGALQSARLAPNLWESGGWPVPLASAFVASSLGAGLIVGLALAFDRADRQMGLGEGEDRRFRFEAPAAWILLAALAIAAIASGRQEIALAASAVLIWFGMRLGLFATALAAFLLTATLLAFGASDGWAALAGADASEGELLRGLALVLLSFPSLLVAAATHDHRSARRELTFRAFHDGLTALANRARFLETLDAAAGAARARGRRFGLFLVDLDHFKAVNDSFGHGTGDALLVEVSRRLRDTVRATDVVARLGGDEFAVIAPVPSADDAAKLAGRLVASVDQPFLHNGLELRPSITVGVALAPDSSVEPARLTAFADHALYEAKAAGRNCWRLSSADAGDAFASDWGEESEPRSQIVYLD